MGRGLATTGAAIRGPADLSRCRPGVDAGLGEREAGGFVRLLDGAQPAAGDEGSPLVARRIRVGAVARLLSARLEARPPLPTFDDAGWADPESRDVILDVARRGSRLGAAWSPRRVPSPTPSPPPGGRG